MADPDPSSLYADSEPSTGGPASDPYVDWARQQQAQAAFADSEPSAGAPPQAPTPGLEFLQDQPPPMGGTPPPMPGSPAAMNVQAQGMFGGPAAPAPANDWSRAGLAAPPGPPATPEQQHQAYVDSNIAKAADEGQSWKPSEDRLADLESGKVAATDRDKTIASLSPEDQAKAVKSMTPDEYSEYKSRDDAARVLADARGRHELESQRAIESQQNYDDLRASVAKADASSADVVADAKRLAATKIDTGRVKKPMLASLFGGMMMQANGGKNLAAEQYQKDIDRDIDAQKSDLANGWKGIETRNGALKDEYARHGDLNRAATALTLAHYETGINMLQTEMQQYDPAGSTARRIRDNLDQLHAAQGQALNAFQQQAQKTEFERRKDAREEATLANTVIHDRAGEADAKRKTDIEAYKASIDADKAKTGKVDAGATFTAAEGVGRGYPDLPAGQWNDKTAGQYYESRNKVQANTKGALDNQSARNASEIRDPSKPGETLAYQSGPKKGQPIVMPADKAIEINQTTSATQEAIDGLSGAYRALDSDPSTFDRIEWAHTQGKLKNALPRLAKVYGEKYSAKTEGALQDVLNADFDTYVNRFKDKGTAKASIREAIDALKRDGDTELGSVTGHDGPSVFRDTSAPPKSKPTKADELARELSTPVHRDLLMGSGPDAEYVRARAFGVPVAGQSQTVERAVKIGVPPSRLEIFDKLKDQAVNGKTEHDRQSAMAAIQTQASQGDSAAMRDYAQSVLTGLFPSIGGDLTGPQNESLRAPVPQSEGEQPEGAQ